MFCILCYMNADVLIFMFCYILYGFSYIKEYSYFFCFVFTYRFKSLLQGPRIRNKSALLQKFDILMFSILFGHTWYIWKRITFLLSLFYLCSYVKVKILKINIYEKELSKYCYVNYLKYWNKILSIHSAILFILCIFFNLNQMYFTL